MSLPIVEQITQNVVDTIETVTVANGYQQDLSVERPKRLGNTPRNNLAVVDQLDPAVADANNQASVAWDQPYIVRVFVIDPEGETAPWHRRANQARSDVEKALQNDVTRGGLAFDTTLDAPAMFRDADGAFVGVEVNFTVRYRVLRSDPYTQ